MSYLVLARKCRPQSFDEVAAQAHITETLKKAIEKDRLSHAYLFCGPRGTGKTTTARILAKALNCQSFDAPTTTPCGECESCVTIAGGRNADVLEIDGASNRGVQEIQALRERVQYAPQGRFKVFIIDEVHMLTKEAFNALLKTLEEPPARVIFIFATTEPQKLPPTIISRCQRFDFRRIPTDTIAGRIKSIAQSEGLTLSDDAAEIVARRADGGLRDSLSLLDQILAYAPKGELSADEVAEILGILPLDAFVQIADRIAEKDPAGAIEELDRLLESGIDISQVASGLAEHLHGALTTALGVHRDDISERATAEYTKLAERIDKTDILRMAKLASDLQTKLKSSSTPRFVFEELLVYLATLDMALDLHNTAASLAPSAQAPVGAARIQAPPPQQAVIQEPDDHPRPPLDPKFAEIIEHFEALRGDAKADMVSHAKMIEDEGRIILKFPHSLNFQVEKLLMKKDNLDALTEAVQKVFGEDTRVKLLVDEPPSEASEPKPKSSTATIPEGVKTILDGFEAKIES